MTTEAPPLAQMRAGWRLFRLHWRVFLLAELMLFASWVVLELSAFAISQAEIPAAVTIAVNVLLHIAFFFVFSGLMVGVHRMALEAVEGFVPTTRPLRSSLSAAPAYLLALTLYCVATLLGLVALMLPGLYFASRYVFFGQVIASHPRSAMDALRDAARLSSGHRGGLFVLVLACAALNIVGAAVLGVGFFVSFPVTLLALTSRFHSLKGSSQQWQDAA